MTRFRTLGALAAIALVGALAPAVHAQVFATPYSYTATLSGSSPYFDRTGAGGAGGKFRYTALSFTPDTTGSYTLETTAASLIVGGDDTFLYFYSGVFDPLNPATNLIASDDDNGIGFLSSITQSLTSGSSYTLVSTTFEQEDTGDVATQISGPGGANINVTSAPEPGSVALLGLAGLPGLGLLRRRK